MNKQAFNVVAELMEAVKMLHVLFADKQFLRFFGSKKLELQRLVGLGGNRCGGISGARQPFNNGTVVKGSLMGKADVCAIAYDVPTRPT